MNIPFEFSVTYSGTAVVKKFFDNTDNLILAGIVSAYSAPLIASKFDIVIPTSSFWLTSFRITADVATKVEFGISDGTNFLNLYSDFGTYAVAGGVVRQFDQSGPQFPQGGTGLAALSTWTAALRVTGATNPSTIRIAGDIGVFPR